MKTYQNYLFDLYGTLVDVHTDEEKPLFWERLSILLKTQGVRYSPDVLHARYCAEVTAREAAAKKERGNAAEIDIAPVFETIYRDGGVCATPEQIAQFAKMFRILSLEKLRLFPGAEALLQRLRQDGKKICLLSNAQALFTLPELQALDLLQYFDGIVISSNEGLKKPDVRLYRRVLARYDLRPEQTVMVGNDDQADCHGAAGAGLESMYVQTEQSPARLRPLPQNCRELETIGQVYG